MNLDKVELTLKKKFLSSTGLELANALIGAACNEPSSDNR